jgi:methionyl-tRNA formyltransferase
VDIVFAGRGRVAARCLDVLGSMPVHYELAEYHNPAQPFDLLLSVHWPYKFTREQLAAPKLGALNLHNSWLPWNGGAHPCTWAIVDKTPHGATMHWITDEIDKGPIFLQRVVAIQDTDTADTLYKRTADAEVQLFRDALDAYRLGSRRRDPQPEGGTYHKKKDFERLVRALSTSDCKVLRDA